MSPMQRAKYHADLFHKINQDCMATGENVVDLTDDEYYAHQIFNLGGLADLIDAKVEATDMKCYVLIKRREGMYR